MRHQSPSHSRILPTTLSITRAVRTESGFGARLSGCTPPVTTAVRLPDSMDRWTQPSVPCQSRTFRQFSNSAVISKGIPRETNIQSTGYRMPGPVRRWTLFARWRRVAWQRKTGVGYGSDRYQKRNYAAQGEEPRLFSSTTTSLHYKQPRRNRAMGQHLWTTGGRPLIRQNQPKEGRP